MKTNFYGFLLALIIMLSMPVYIFCQTGIAINTTGASADPSAILDVSSSSHGVLVPRITSADKIAISSPARGLLIYQVDSPSGFWYFDGTVWAQVGGSSGGITCASPTGDETARYDYASGQWECTKMIQVMKGGYKSYVSIGNNVTPSAYFSLWVRDRDTITFPPDPTIYYYDDTRVGIGYSPYSSSSVSLSVDGGTHIADGLRVGTTASPPTDGILSYGDIKSQYGDIVVGSSSYGFCVGSYCGVSSTTLPFVATISYGSTSGYVATASASTSSHSLRTFITALSVCTKTMTIRGGIITGL